MEASAIVRTLFPSSLMTAIFLIFGGCCSNVYTLEAITHVVPNCGTLVTFAQFLGVTIGGFSLFSLSYDGRKAIWDRKVPLTEYCKIVGFHFSVSIVNNLALAYHISVPVHIILRSGGSMVTMLLGYTFLKKKYTLRQIAAVLLVTMGVIISTSAGSGSATHEDDTGDRYSTFVLGVALSRLAPFLLAPSAVRPP